GRCAGPAVLLSRASGQPPRPSLDPLAHGPLLDPLLVVAAQDDALDEDRWDVNRSGSISPTSTSCSTSAIVTLAALHISGEKLRAVSRKTRFPHLSPLKARTIAKSATSGDSSTYSRPSMVRVSFPAAI